MKLLVGYDGSNPSKAAVMQAQRYTEVCDTKIKVVHAITRVTPLSIDRIQETEQIFEKEIKNLFGSNHIAYKTTLLVGEADPGEQIVNYAKTINAEEIIIGCGGKSKMSKFIFGSTAQYVVMNALCPVMVVK